MINWNKEKALFGVSILAAVMVLFSAVQNLRNEVGVEFELPGMSQGTPPPKEIDVPWVEVRAQVSEARNPFEAVSGWSGAARDPLPAPQCGNLKRRVPLPAVLAGSSKALPPLETQMPELEEK